MEKWVVSAKRADFKKIAERFGIDQVTARIIRNREVLGEQAIDEYLHGTLEHLHAPEEMKDMERAAAILQEKLQKKKKIRILGDYDIDGVQSVYILYSALRRCHAEVDYAIPDRIADGYGLNERLVRQAMAEGVDTILTCDNGIAAAAEVSLAKELGMTVILTDHHEVPYEESSDGKKIYQVPPADAVVNPKQPDCPYPFKALAGVGVALKLCLALAGPEREGELLETYADLCALGTVADVMTLTDENRTIVRHGLSALPHTARPGLLALLREAGAEGKALSPTTPAGGRSWPGSCAP